jgi:PKD repeat protein
VKKIVILCTVVLFALLQAILPIGCQQAEPAPTTTLEPPATLTPTPEATTTPAPTLNADFTASQTEAKVSSAIEFTDQSTGDINTWLWDFGDGNTSTEQNPSHIYNDAGTYTVTLTVNNPINSDTEEKKDYITVSSFLVRRLVMCSSVSDFDEFTPQPNAIYHVGDSAWIYFELMGFEQRKTDDMYEIWVQWTRLRITDPNGKLMGDASDISERNETIGHMEMPIVSFWIDIGDAESSDPLGEYTVEVTAKDVISGATATESTTFILE